MFPNLPLGLRRAVTHGPAGHSNPLAKLADRDVESVFLQCLAGRLDQFSSSPNGDCNPLRARSSRIASP
jgi:hypothetical protein